jgi:hypothetical protein
MASSYTNCRVSDVQDVTLYSGDKGFGYGFGILGGPHGRPLVTFAFATKADADQARAEVTKAVEKAVEITLTKSHYHRGPVTRRSDNVCR